MKVQQLQGRRKKRSNSGSLTLSQSWQIGKQIKQTDQKGRQLSSARIIGTQLAQPNPFAVRTYEENRNKDLEQNLGSYKVTPNLKQVQSIQDRCLYQRKLGERQEYLNKLSNVQNIDHQSRAGKQQIVVAKQLVKQDSVSNNNNILQQQDYQEQRSITCANTIKHCEEQRSLATKQKFVQSMNQNEQLGTSVQIQKQQLKQQDKKVSQSGLSFSSQDTDLPNFDLQQGIDYSVKVGSSNLCLYNKFKRRHDKDKGKLQQHNGPGQKKEELSSSDEDIPSFDLVDKGQNIPTIEEEGLHIYKAATGQVLDGILTEVQSGPKLRYEIQQECGIQEPRPQPVCINTQSSEDFSQEMGNLQKGKTLSKITQTQQLPPQTFHKQIDQQVVTKEIQYQNPAAQKESATSNTVCKVRVIPKSFQVGVKKVDNNMLTKAVVQDKKQYEMHGSQVQQLPNQKGSNPISIQASYIEDATYSSDKSLEYTQSKSFSIRNRKCQNSINPHSTCINNTTKFLNKIVDLQQKRTSMLSCDEARTDINNNIIRENFKKLDSQEHNLLDSQFLLQNSQIDQSQLTPTLRGSQSCTTSLQNIDSLSLNFQQVQAQNSSQNTCEKRKLDFQQKPFNREQQKPKNLPFKTQLSAPNNIDTNSDKITDENHVIYSLATNSNRNSVHQSSSTDTSYNRKIYLHNNCNRSKKQYSNDNKTISKSILKDEVQRNNLKNNDYLQQQNDIDIRNTLSLPCYTAQVNLQIDQNMGLKSPNMVDCQYEINCIIDQNKHINQIQKEQKLKTDNLTLEHDLSNTKQHNANTLSEGGDDDVDREIEFNIRQDQYIQNKEKHDSSQDYNKYICRAATTQDSKEVHNITGIDPFQSYNSRKNYDSPAPQQVGRQNNFEQEDMYNLKSQDMDLEQNTCYNKAFSVSGQTIKQGQGEYLQGIHENIPWWQELLVDFVPVALMQDQIDPRNNSKIYIDYLDLIPSQNEDNQQSNIQKKELQIKSGIMNPIKKAGKNKFRKSTYGQIQNKVLSNSYWVTESGNVRVYVDAGGRKHTGIDAYHIAQSEAPRYKVGKSIAQGTKKLRKHKRKRRRQTKYKRSG